MFVVDEPEMLRKIGGCCWEGVMKKHPTGADVCRCFFLYPKVEKGGGHRGVIIYICIIYLYFNTESLRSVSSSSHSRLERSTVASTSLSLQSWQLCHPNCQENEFTFYMIPGM